MNLVVVNIIKKLGDFASIEIEDQDNIIGGTEETPIYARVTVNVNPYDGELSKMKTAAAIRAEIKASATQKLKGFDNQQKMTLKVGDTL